MSFQQKDDIIRFGITIFVLLDLQVLWLNIFTEKIKIVILEFSTSKILTDATA